MGCCSAHLAASVGQRLNEFTGGLAEHVAPVQIGIAGWAPHFCSPRSFRFYSQGWPTLSKLSRAQCPVLFSRKLLLME
jgi:hypothetical protein